MRRTRISDDALLAIFEGKRPKPLFAQSPGLDADAPPPVRFNSVASQCELDGAYMELCDVLIRSQQTGVMTVQHAKERRAVQLWSDKLLLDLRLEERHHRERIMADRRDVLELMRTMLLALAPPASPRGGGRYRLRGNGSAYGEGSVRGDVSPTRGSASLRSLSPNGSIQTLHSGGAIVITTASGSAFVPDVAVGRTTELERLQERVVELETQLAQKMKLDWIVHPGSSTRSNKVLDNLPRDVEQEVLAMAQTFNVLEQQERTALTEREAEVYTSIYSQHRLAVAETLLVEQRRFLVQTPYEAYRPRIPLQHSLKGEEYLRRWLMAETFKHYEDVMGQLQSWENAVRCDIEDEALATFPLLKANVFEPHYRARVGLLEEELIELRYHKVMHERDASALASAAKIRVLCEAEERGREQAIYYERIDRERIAEVGSSLAVLKDVQKTVVSLRGELERATVRHREEMIGLHQHLTALDEVGRAERENEALAKREAYLESAFVRGTAAGAEPFYETLAKRSATGSAIGPRPPSSAVGDGGVPPRSGRRASGAALGVPVTSSRGSSLATPRRVGQEKALSSPGGSSKPLSHTQHAQQTKDIYSRPVQRRNSNAASSTTARTASVNSRQQQQQGSAAYWAGF